LKRLVFVFLGGTPAQGGTYADRSSLGIPLHRFLVACPLRDFSDTADKARKGFAMAKNIYVGNLVWDATADDLLALFQEHGQVARAQVITDRETGRSRGFGFVEMDDDAEAQKAIDALNGTQYKSRPLTVNEARPREERGPGGGGGGAGGGRGGYGGGRGGYGGGGGGYGGAGGGGRGRY
jgi:RNA recognition motif-containing protein